MATMAASGAGTWAALDEAGRAFAHEKILGSGWRLRTVAVDLGGDRLLVVGPVRRIGDGALRALNGRGTPAYLLAPNHFHHLGIPEWCERFPEARPVAAPAALPRLAGQCPVVFEPLDVLEGALPDGMRLVLPEGTRNGEVWIVVEGGAPGGGDVWIVCDAFFNCPTHPTGTFGVGCRLTGTTAGLRIGATWRWMHLADRKRYRAWLLDRLERAPPSRLVPAHGNVLDGEGLADRLRALAERRL